MNQPRRSLLVAIAALSLSSLGVSAPADAARPKPLIAPLTADEQALVDQAAAYLQGIGEAKGSFVQTNARGGVTRGTVYIKRPGKARFEYDPPSGMLVVANGRTVAVNDQRLKTFDSYPLGATPLSLFLARNIKIDRGVVVSKVTRGPDSFSITLRDGKKEAEGQITLTFASNPIHLTQWTLTDAQGASTRVAINGLEPTSGLSPSLFVLRDPRIVGTAK